MSDLIERLRQLASNTGKMTWVNDLPMPATAVLHLAADEIERLTVEVQRLDHSTTHTCWDECPRLACAQRREIEALTAQLAEAREIERAAIVDWLETHSSNSGYFTDPFDDAASAINAGEHLT